MKTRIFSVILTLVLLLSMSLVTALPVSATGVDILNQTRLSAYGDTIVAEWDTSTVYSGDYSAHLAVPDGTGNFANIVHMDIGDGDNVTLGSIDTIQFMEYLVSPGGSAEISAAVILFMSDETPPVEGSTSPWTGVEDNAITFHYDGETALGEWTTQDMSDEGWVGYLNSATETVEPLSYWKTNNPALVVAYVSVAAGEGDWSGYDGYIDNVIVTTAEGSDTYLTEPRIVNGTGYNYIQEAIDAASPSDTIDVAAGTYIEDLDISTSIDLIGAGATIKGVAMTASTFFPLAAPNINITANDVSLSGFTIQGPDVTLNYYSSGIVIGGSNVEIYDNAFEVTNAPNLADIGQAIQTWLDNDISGLSIHDNTFTSHGAGATGYEAIYINPDVGAGEVSIADNVFGGTLFRAITTERSNVTMSGNSITLIGSLEASYRYAAAATGDIELDAQNNWWGQSSGPADGAISGDVDAEPWLFEIDGDQYDKTLALNSGWSIVSPDKEITGYEIVDSTGLVYTYNNGAFAEAIDLNPISPVFVKTVDGGGIGFNYAENSQGIFTTDLEVGWNLMGIPQTGGESYDILSPLRYGSGSEIALATIASQGNYNLSGGSFYQATLSDADWGDLPELYPLGGYWAYMNVAKEFGVVVTETP